MILCESVALLLGLALAAIVRFGRYAPVVLAEEHVLWKGLLVVAVAQICMYLSDLYDLRVSVDRRELFVRTVQALGATALVLAVLYFLAPVLIIGRGVFAIAAAILLTLVIGWRFAFDLLLRRLGARERLLIIGTGEGAVRLARELHDRRQELGVDIVGFIDPDPARLGERIINPGVIGRVSDIPEIIRREAVDRVVVSLADARGKLPMDELLDLRLTGVSFNHLATVYEDYTGKIALENLRPSWLLFSSGFRVSRLTSCCKRVTDVLFSAFALIAGLPLMLLIAAAIRLTSPGPVLYHQPRVGRNGRVFMLHKFRSMRTDAERGGPAWATAGDPRVTRVGRFLRRYRLDELPQVWNILSGQMSLVGPRPERPEFVDQLTKEVRYYAQRHAVKPGLTGWAQVRYTYGASVEDATEKLQHDLFYIKNLSFALDLFIILKTFKIVLLGRGAR